MNIQENIIIESPAGEVFSYMMDVRNRSDYIPMLEEVIMLDEPPIQLGSRYIEVATIANQRLETTYQVIDFEQDKRISVKTLKSVFPIQVDIDLIPEKNHTKVLLNMDFKLSGIFRLAATLVKGIVRKQAQDILQRLKQQIES